MCTAGGWGYLCFASEDECRCLLSVEQDDFAPRFCYNQVPVTSSSSLVASGGVIAGVELCLKKDEGEKMQKKEW